jgi:ribosome maturation factor RimP
MGIKEKIEVLVSKHFTDESYFIVEISISGGEAAHKISVMIDSDKGVNIDDCAKLSRKLGADLEEMEMLTSAYNLEVSSPGLDKPLKIKRQYIKSKGRKLSVINLDDTIHTGILEAVNENSITLLSEVRDKANKKRINIVPMEIPFAEIKKTNVIVSFK